MTNATSLFANTVFANAINSKKFKDVSARINANHVALPNTPSFPHTGTAITTIPAGGIILNTPGSYYLANDIVWTPTSAAIAIAITSNNITLDLAGHSVTCVNPSNFSTIGVIAPSFVSTPLSYVTVKNGSLINMSFYGVHFLNCNFVTIDNIVVDGINLNDLAVRFLTPCGIIISTCTNFTVYNCRVKNMNVTTDSCAGIQIISSTNGTVKKCKLNTLRNNDGAVQGYSYILSSDVITKDCKAYNLESYFGGNVATTGHTVLGFCPIFCNLMIFDHCLSKNMVGCCDDAHGLSVFLDTNIIVKNFNVENVLDGVAASETGAKATGIEVYGINVLVKNCRVRNIKAIRPQDGQSAAYSATGTNIEFRDCSAEDVKVLNKHQRPDTSYGLGVGFGWAPDPRPELVVIPALNVKYVRCKAVDCQIGFDTWNHIDSLWDEIKTIKCGTGLLKQHKAIRKLFCNACSECNPSITIYITNTEKNNKFRRVRVL